MDASSQAGLGSRVVGLEDSGLLVSLLSSTFHGSRSILGEWVAIGIGPHRWVVAAGEIRPRALGRAGCAHAGPEVAAGAGPEAWLSLILVMFWLGSPGWNHVGNAGS